MDRARARVHINVQLIVHNLDQLHNQLILPHVVAILQHDAVRLLFFLQGFFLFDFYVLESIKYIHFLVFPWHLLSFFYDLHIYIAQAFT